MSVALPTGGRAVMAQRLDPIDSLDFFPTPPWATRALCEVAAPALTCARDMIAWEPAAGAGHMAEVLREYFGEVVASDVHDYAKGYEIGSFVGDGSDVAPTRFADWVITNPPFNLAAAFAMRAIEVAERGVALLVRTAWLEGADRYRRLFSVYPPSRVALFAERVPMVKGRWDPKASTATSYAWVIWTKKPNADPLGTDFRWIPPRTRAALTKPDDVARFA